MKAVLKLLGLLISLAALASQSHAGAAYESVCLSTNEQTYFKELQDESDEAKRKLKQDCEKQIKTASCLPPLRDRILTLYSERDRDCSALPEATKRFDGIWAVASRICERSGQPARDRFRIDRDRMYLMFSNGTASLLVLNGDERTPIGAEGWLRINRARTELELSTTAFGKPTTEIWPVELTAQGELVLTSGGYREGGSCEPGDTLKTRFVRTQTIEL